MAQYALNNKAFKGGEFLSYNLYFNWKLLWVKAGTASMSTVETTYNGQRAYRASLTTKSSKQVDDVFVMRDTILCYTTRDLMPLYYRKGAREGKRYYVDQLFYTYRNRMCYCTAHQQKASGRHTKVELSSKEDIYDMMSIFLNARNFSDKNLKKGAKFPFNIADGNGLQTAYLLFKGRTTVKADNGKKYRCLQLSYVEREGIRDKEIVSFYVTDDLNHIPIRLDMFLKFGTAKAFLTSMKGMRNPVTSLTK